eukprot:3284462-Rhodomonas_salina.1
MLPPPPPSPTPGSDIRPPPTPSSSFRFLEVAEHGRVVLFRALHPPLPLHHAPLPLGQRLFALNRRPLFRWYKCTHVSVQTLTCPTDA